MTKTHTENSFKTLSGEIAQNFLQTVMVVDDQAYFVEEEEFKTSVPAGTEVKKIKKPKGIRVGNKVDEITLTPPLPPSESNDEKVAEHRLNAKVLTDSFADVGIACTVIRPKTTEEKQLESRIMRLAEKSDIVIFDWILQGDDAEGKKTSQFISDITKNSIKVNRKLRLIAVYTGNADLDIVLDSVENRLTEDGLSPVKDAENLTITVDAVRIGIFAKKYAQIPEESHLYNRQIGEEQIPERLIRDFSEMTSGLVSNVALQSFAVIRDNTHHILAKFRPELDAPFLSHRLMLPHPTDANTYLSNLIGDEITALLEGKKAGYYADKLVIGKKTNEYLKEWLKQFSSSKDDWHDDWNSMLMNGKSTKDDIAENIYKVLSEDGNPNKKIMSDLVETELEADRKKEIEKITASIHTLETTKRFAAVEHDAEKLDREFAYLTTVNSSYADKPFLKFGTVIKEITNQTPKYWLCVQPLCDCVRVPGRRKFPFLKLELFEDRSKNFDLVLKEEDDYFKVSIVYKPYESEFIKFKPNDKQVIGSINEDDEFIFRSVPENQVERKFEWLGDLKFAQAQRVANNYASTMSRVGLDESEWLRRWATTGKMEN